MFKRRKKHPKLPNGFGSIRYIGTGRRNPYAVHPPSKQSDDNGLCSRPKVLAYATDYLQGMQILMAYHSGTLTEDFLQNLRPTVDSSEEAIQSILSSYNTLVSVQSGRKEEYKYTFEEVYLSFIEHKKIGKDGNAPAKVTISAYVAAYSKFQSISHLAFEDLRFTQIQNVINESTAGYSTKKNMIKLLNQMGKYAKKYLELDSSQYSGFEVLDKNDIEHGIPFTEDQIKSMHKHLDDFGAETLYLLCYTGHRINELRIVTYDEASNCLIGGNKTNAGQHKLVPVHEAVTDIIKRRLQKYNCLLPYGRSKVYREIYKFLINHNMNECINPDGIPTHHTPHDCRHTFAMLCDHYGVEERIKKRLIGHSFSDITNSVYGHTLLEDLRKGIEKIPTL